MMVPVNCDDQKLTDKDYVLHMHIDVLHRILTDKDCDDQKLTVDDQK